MRPLFERLSKISFKGRLKIGEGYRYLVIAGASFGLGAVLFGSCGVEKQSTATGDASTGHEGHEQSNGAIYTCSMHPQIRSPEPGKCPICGMDLIPVESSGAMEIAPERVTLSARAQALAKLQTTVVQRSSQDGAELRLLGRVEADETKSRTVTSWIGGRIERLHVKVTGEKVKSGQPIATLYSPEVLAAHQDLIAARRQMSRLSGGSATARSAAGVALDAARDRLRLLGISESRVKAMEAEEQPSRQVTISSPFPGTVIERMASEGAYVGTGEALYRVADLSSIWVQLDAYERDLPLLQVGQLVDISVESLPDRVFQGKIAFINPTLDVQRRTAQVRVEVENKEGVLRPGTFAQALVQGSLKERAESPLVVPQTSPLFTGRRSIVYVEVEEADEPTYEARVVRLGPRAGDVYPVVTGLREGERVVTRGAFTLDADLQIRGGASMMSGPDDEDKDTWEVATPLPQEKEQLAPLVASYLKIQEALAADALHPAHDAAKEFEQALRGVQLSQTKKVRDIFLAHEAGLRKSNAAILQARDLEGARGPFEDLSGHMVGIFRSLGNASNIELGVASCPMAFGRGAVWIQKSGDLKNPYFGKSMLDCGQIDHVVEPSAHLQDAKKQAQKQRAGSSEHRH